MSLKPTIATLNQCSERSGAWVRLFGSTSVVIKSPVPLRADLPGLGVREVYFVDLEKLSDEQLDRIAREMSLRFSLPLPEVTADLRSLGLPILAEDISVSFDARLVL